MNTRFAVMPILMLMGCAFVPLTDPGSLQKYDDVRDCGFEAARNAVRADCAERFKNTEITGEVDSVGLSLGQPYLALRVRNAHYLHCRLEGAQDRDRLAALDPGDLVTVSGTPIDIEMITKGTYLEMVIFQPCVLMPGKKRDLYVPAH